MSRPHDPEVFDEPEDSGDPQLTEIVAYLDGELDEADCTRLERALASSPPLRGYAESLDRTWQLLDSLAEPSVSDEFIHRTLASLATIEQSDEQTARTAKFSWTRLLAAIPFAKVLIWTLAGFLGCSAGLFMARSSSRQQKDSEDVRLLRQLELLEEYPRIYPIPSAAFLKQIAVQENARTQKEKQP